MRTPGQTRRNRFIPTNYLTNRFGFTLIEMAIVVMIIGVIISIVSTVLPSLVRTSKIKKAQATLEKVDYALQGYIFANGQVPCPDTDIPPDGVENRVTGTNSPTDDTCSAYVGTLPFATLGLSSGTDAWQNPIRYGVYEGLVRTTQSNLCSQLPCAPCLADFVSNPTSAWLSTSDGSTVINAGYALASGGAKDMDGDSDFFDGRNASAPTTAQFESPNKIIDPGYDDILRTGDLTYLQGRLCTGGGASGGSGSGNVEICDDVGANDEDGDGLANCNDPDCAGSAACVGGTNVIIITPSFPSGIVNDTYATTVQASGGTTPYEWEISNNGGFSELFLHTYTGQISGSLDQCPGTYSVTVQVTDTTATTPTTDSRAYTIGVAANLAVSRTSGAGTDIDWMTATQEENFQANGGHLGDMTWSLSTGGADGFSVTENGSSGCTVKKSGETTTGVGPYTFVLTAEDESCPGNTAHLTFTVTVPAGGTGAAAPYTVGMEAFWRFDECTVWDGTSYDVEDYLGNALHYGRRIGDVAGTTNGKICHAASFDGTSARIVSDVLTGSDIMGFSDQVTLACWFKSPGGGGGNPRLIEFSDPAGSYTRSTALAYDPDGSMRAWVTSEAGVRGGQIDYATTRYDDDEWHHAVYTYGTANGGRLYIDGDLKQTRTDNPTSDIHDAETFVIGGYYPDGDHGFLGLIDEAAVFQRELTAAEVVQLYASTRSSCPGSCYSAPVAEYQMENAPWDGTAGEVYDTGSGGSNGVAAFSGSGALPTQTDTGSGKICRSAVFTRVDSTNGAYLDLGDPADGNLDPNTRAWTVTAWVYWDGSSGENIIYNKENLYEARVSGGYVNYAWRPYWYWVGGTSFPVTANAWTHVATTYEGNEQVLFKNGLPVYSRAETGGSVGSNSSKLLIGARGSSSPYNFFGGMIDEVRIYDRALSHSEILSMVSETRTCP